MAEYNVDPDLKFNKEISKSIKAIGDLTIPFKLMTREWYKGNRSIFDPGRKSKGKFEDLTPKYKNAKIKALGSAYPILRGFLKKKGQPVRRSNKLAKSMINASNPDSVAVIINKRSLILGTKVTNEDGEPYPRHLHFGTKKMVARPFVLIGGEQTATKEINKRRENWVNMLKDFVIQSSEGFAT